MTEAELERAVRDLFKVYGLLAYHPHDSRRSEPGWPDWCIVGKRIIWRELKSADGRLSRAQIAWGRAINAAGGNWKVWRPVDLDLGVIAGELRAIA